MKIAELVGMLSKDFVKFENEAEILQSDVSYLESQLTLVQCKRLFTDFATCTEPATKASLQPFCEMLAKRWQRVCNTDEIFLHQPHSPANRFCFALAQQLSQILNTDAYVILMPTLKVDSHALSKKPLSAYQPHAFELDDSNQYPIDVYACLKSANHEGFRHSTLIDGHVKQLSETEIKRVIEHSPRTLQLYKNMCDDERLGFKSKATENAERKLKNEINQIHALTIKTYGATGQAALKLKLFLGIEDGESLIQFMLNFKSTDWERLLNAIDDPNMLSKCLLNGRTLTQAVKDKRFYNGDETHDRAALFAFMFFYRQQLALRPHEFNTLFGQLSGYGISKQKKLEASFIPYQLLKAGTKLSELLALSMDKITSDEKLSSTDKELLKRALNNGSLTGMLPTLPTIMQQAALVATSSYHSDAYRPWFSREIR